MFDKSLLCALALSLFLGSGVVNAEPQTDTNCAQILASSNMNTEEKQIFCRLYQSSTALAQFGAVVTDSLERFMAAQMVGDADADVHVQAKRKHEYLRFGKRKHEYLRFGRK